MEENTDGDDGGSWYSLSAYSEEASFKYFAWVGPFLPHSYPEGQFLH